MFFGRWALLKGALLGRRMFNTSPSAAPFASPSISNIAFYVGFVVAHRFLEYYLKFVVLDMYSGIIKITKERLWRRYMILR